MTNISSNTLTLLLNCDCITVFLYIFYGMLHRRLWMFVYVLRVSVYIACMYLWNSSCKSGVFNYDKFKNQWHWHYFCSLTKRYLQCPHRKPTEWLTECICSNQKERRRRDKTPTHKIDVQSLTASVAEPQMNDSTPVWYLLVDHEVKINKAYYRNVMLLQQFLLAIRQMIRSQASSSSFGRRVPRHIQPLGSQLSFP